MSLKEINVVSRWGVLIIGMAKRDLEFLELVQKTLTNREWPFSHRLVEVRARTFGRTQVYLETIGPDKTLAAYVGAETIGRDLYVNWSLLYTEASVFAKLAGIADILKAVDFNQANSARAFATSLNHAVQEAADLFLDAAGMDKNKVDRDASGLLGKLL